MGHFYLYVYIINTIIVYMNVDIVSFFIPTSLVEHAATTLSTRILPAFRYKLLHTIERYVRVKTKQYIH